MIILLIMRVYKRDLSFHARYFTDKGVTPQNLPTPTLRSGVDRTMRTPSVKLL
jgi:hypothetical protein